MLHLMSYQELSDLFWSYEREDEGSSLDRFWQYLEGLYGETFEDVLGEPYEDFMFDLLEDPDEYDFGDEEYEEE